MSQLGVHLHIALLFGIGFIIIFAIHASSNRLFPQWGQFSRNHSPQKQVALEMHRTMQIKYAHEREIEYSHTLHTLRREKHN